MYCYSLGFVYSFTTPHWSIFSHISHFIHEVCFKFTLHLVFNPCTNSDFSKVRRKTFFFFFFWRCFQISCVDAQYFCMHIFKMCIKEVDGTNAFNEGRPPLSHLRAVGDTSRPVWRDLHVLCPSTRLFGFSPLARMHFYQGGDTIRNSADRK